VGENYIGVNVENMMKKKLQNQSGHWKYVKIFDKKELKCGEDNVVNSVTYRGSFLLKSLIDGNYHMWKKRD
jgi:hypothetical protein